MAEEPQSHIIFKTIHGTFWLILGRGASMIAGIVATVFIVRKLGPEQYGYVPLINSMLGMAMILADGGLGPSTAFHLATCRNKESSASRLLARTLRLRLFTLIPICILFYALIPSVADLLHVPVLTGGLPLIVTGLLFVLSLSRWTGKAYEGLGEAGRLGQIRTFLSLASPISQVLLVSLGLGVLGVIGGQVFGNGIAIAILLLVLMRKFGRNREDFHECGETVSLFAVIRYALPLMVIHGSLFIFTQSAVLILKYYHPIQEVSYYGLAAQIVVLSQIPALSVASATAPQIATLNLDKQERASALLSLSLRSLVIVYAPLSAFIAVAAPAIIIHLFSVEFLPAAPILRAYAIYIFFSAMGGFASMSLDYAGKARLRMWIVGGGAISNLVFCFLLIPRFGSMGAVLAVQAAHIPLIVIYLILLKRHHRLSIRRLPRFSFIVFLATVVSGGLLHVILTHHHHSLPALISGILIASGCYGILLIMAGIINPLEICDVLRSKVHVSPFRK